MIITWIVVALWVLTVVGYVVFNLYQKNKKLENMVVKQQLFINEVMANYKEIDLLVDKIDKTLWVQSDPEFLQLIEEMKNLQGMIKQYTESK
tara:strand:+ start:854 stop:1129 length:276 start_codon:yes stop_codon:yes gene_type:complete